MSLFDFLFLVAVRFIGFVATVLVYRGRVRSLWGPIVCGLMFVFASPRADNLLVSGASSCGAALLTGIVSQRRRTNDQRPT